MLEFAIAILYIVALWFLFEKAGDHGWKSLIPIYNSYTLCKLADCVGLFVARLIVNVLLFAETVIVLFIFSFSYADLYMNAVSASLDTSDPDFLSGILTPSMLAGIVVCGLIFLLLLVISIVLSILINRKFTKAYTEKTVLVVLACFGAVPPLYLLQIIVFCILAFSNNFVYRNGSGDYEKPHDNYYTTM